MQCGRISGPQWSYSQILLGDMCVGGGPPYFSSSQECMVIPNHKEHKSLHTVWFSCIQWTVLSTTGDMNKIKRSVLMSGRL